MSTAFTVYIIIALILIFVYAYIHIKHRNTSISQKILLSSYMLISIAFPIYLRLGVHYKIQPFTWYNYDGEELRILINITMTLSILPFVYNLIKPLSIYITYILFILFIALNIHFFIETNDLFFLMRFG